MPGGNSMDDETLRPFVDKSSRRASPSKSSAPKKQRQDMATLRPRRSFSEVSHKGFNKPDGTRLSTVIWCSPCTDLYYSMRVDASPEGSTPEGAVQTTHAQPIPGIWTRRCLFATKD